MQQKAKENNIETQEFCDLNSRKFRELFDLSKIEYDDFIRTSETRHKDFVMNFWEKLQLKNKIKKCIFIFL